MKLERLIYTGIIADEMIISINFNHEIFRGASTDGAKFTFIEISSSSLSQKNVITRQRRREFIHMKENWMETNNELASIEAIRLQPIAKY